MISISGESPDFKQVALQAKEFEKSNMITNTVVTELGYDANESSSFISFAIQATVNPTLVSYGSSPQRVETSRAPAPAPIVEQETSTSTGVSL
jgi:hypothetical protein